MNFIKNIMIIIALLIPVTYTIIIATPPDSKYIIKQSSGLYGMLYYTNKYNEDTINHTIEFNSIRSGSDVKISGDYIIIKILKK